MKASKNILNIGWVNIIELNSLVGAVLILGFNISILGVATKLIPQKVWFQNCPEDIPRLKYIGMGYWIK